MAQEKKGGFLSNLWNKGELPTVTTEVEFSSRTLVILSLVVIIVCTIVILTNKIIKKI